jgi:hypothetical protein
MPGQYMNEGSIVPLIYPGIYAGINLKFVLLALAE